MHIPSGARLSYGGCPSHVEMCTSKIFYDKRDVCKKFIDYPSLLLSLFIFLSSKTYTGGVSIHQIYLDYAAKTLSGLFSQLVCQPLITINVKDR